MFDLGWTELLLIGIVALIVVGPKDLPGMFRTLGRFTGKMRNMAREFSRAMNEAADEAGVKDVKDMASGLKSATSPTKLGLDRLNDAADRFEQWDPAGTTKKKPPQNAREAAGLPEDRAEAAKKIHEFTETKEREKRAAAAADADATEAPPARPAAKAGKPAAKTAKPAAKTAKPAAKTTKPAAKPAKYAAKTARPAAKAAKPAAKTAKPAAKPAKTAATAGKSPKTAPEG
jgi:sec-independent protein translocase protein TatB